MHGIHLVSAFLDTDVGGILEVFFIPYLFQESSQMTYAGCQTCR